MPECFGIFFFFVNVVVLDCFCTISRSAPCAAPGPVVFCWEVVDCDESSMASAGSPDGEWLGFSSVVDIMWVG